MQNITKAVEMFIRISWNLMYDELDQMTHQVEEQQVRYNAPGDDKHFISSFNSVLHPQFST